MRRAYYNRTHVFATITFLIHSRLSHSGQEVSALLESYRRRRRAIRDSRTANAICACVHPVQYFSRPRNRRKSRVRVTRK